MFKFFRVSGDSLYPYLKDKQRIFCMKIFRFSSIKINDIVVFFQEGHGLLIKRVTRIENEQYWLEGTDAYSVDSRNFGFVTKEALRYRKVL